MDPAAPRHRLPVVHRTISFNSPRSVIFLNAAAWPALGLFCLAIVFTIWPQALEHAPISFERRGIIHHIWHYSLLGGSIMALYGMFSANVRRLQFEFAGILMLLAAMSMNLVAVTAQLIATGGEEPTGVGFAARLIVAAMLVTRGLVLIFEPRIFQPVVEVPGPPTPEGG